MDATLKTLAERVVEVETENARLRAEVATLTKALELRDAEATASELDRHVYGDLITVIEQVDRAEKLNLREIGRASCRERV